MPTALEAGTLNGHGIAGLNAGLDYILSTGVKNIHAKEISLARRFVNGISDISDLKLYGDIDAPLRTPIISLNIGNMSSASVSDILWEDYEICVRAGAHCAPLMHKTFGTEKQGPCVSAFHVLTPKLKLIRLFRQCMKSQNNFIFFKHVFGKKCNNFINRVLHMTNHLF